MKNAGVVAVIALMLLAIEVAIDRLKPLIGGIWLALVAISLAALILLLGIHFAHARDNGQWDNADPAIAEWYRTLMQPDVPEASCCGEADAYWCDDVHVRNDKTFCRITDDREDAPRGRPHIAIGSEYEIPPNKLKWDRSNPTGHFIIFLSRAGYVFCFVQASGI